MAPSRVLREGYFHDALIEVTAKNKPVTVEPNIVNPGDTFLVKDGPFKNGTLGPDIEIEVNGVFNVEIHTSCSQPIGPGQIAGDFLVVSGRSRLGGLLCDYPL